MSPCETYQADILIEDGVIQEIGRNLAAPQAQVIDAAGKYVIPGGVDVHTHMDPQKSALLAG